MDEKKFNQDGSYLAEAGEKKDDKEVAAVSHQCLELFVLPLLYLNHQLEVLQYS